MVEYAFLCVYFSLLSLGRYAELLVAFRNHITKGHGKQSGLSLLQLSYAAYKGRLSILVCMYVHK